MKKNLLAITMCIIVVFTLAGCDSKTSEVQNDNLNSNNQTMANSTNKNKTYSKIKFSEMYETKDGVKNISEIYKSLDGKEVEMTGYMAVQSPLDESYIYLVNQPYVSCPFCAIGDITKLEIIPVYMADSSAIKYTENGVTIKGKLEVGEKVDALDYTTQCRIYADKVEEIKEADVDTELQTYYANLSQAGMIIDIQTLQMNIEYATKEEYLAEFGTTKVEMYDGVVEYYAPDMIGYVNYIKECPDIVMACMPERADLQALNTELYDLYEKQIKVLEEFAILILSNQDGTKTDSEKEALYDSLLALNDDNLKLYDEFNAWNNKLRE